MPESGHGRIDEYQIGDRASVTRKFSAEDVARFAELTGDNNPIHLDDAVAARSRFGERVVHGMLTASLLSRLIGTELPGRGAIYLRQEMRFTAPVRIGEEIVATVEVATIDRERRRLTLSTTCVNQRGETVLSGEALVLVDG